MNPPSTSRTASASTTLEVLDGSGELTVRLSTPDVHAAVGNAAVGPERRGSAEKASPPRQAHVAPLPLDDGQDFDYNNANNAHGVASTAEDPLSQDIFNVSAGLWVALGRPGLPTTLG